MTLPTRAYPAPTAQVAPYAKVLGTELTIDFLLAFGGAELVRSNNPTERSALVQLLGLEVAQTLAGQAHLMQRRVPLAKKWLALCGCRFRSRRLLD